MARAALIAASLRLTGARRRRTPSGEPTIVGAIVLAAGRSTRMGQGNKLLADLGGAPVIARTVDSLAAAGLPPPVVVLGHLAPSVRGALCGRAARFVVATDYSQGLSRSLAAGLEAAPANWHAALVMLGDMPVTAPTTLAAIARAATKAASVVVPVHDGRRGNPVAWGRDHWSKLLALTGDSGARVLLADVTVTELSTGDGGIMIDVDTASSLTELRRAYGSSSSI